jgi:hypothetical protein
VLQPLISRSVALAFGVLPAIDFYHQLGSATGEIRDVRTDRQLSRELGPIAGEQFPNLPLFAGRAEA